MTFCFDFDNSHARCSCCSIVSLCFHVVQIKQVDCKIVLKMIISKIHFVIFLDNFPHKSIKPRKKQIVRLQLNVKKLNES